MDERDHRTVFTDFLTQLILYLHPGDLCLPEVRDTLLRSPREGGAIHTQVRAHRPFFTLNWFQGNRPPTEPDDPERCTQTPFFRRLSHIQYEGPYRSNPLAPLSRPPPAFSSFGPAFFGGSRNDSRELASSDRTGASRHFAINLVSMSDLAIYRSLRTWISLFVISNDDMSVYR